MNICFSFSVRLHQSSRYHSMSSKQEGRWNWESGMQRNVIMRELLWIYLHLNCLWIWCSVPLCVYFLFSVSSQFSSSTISVMRRILTQDGITALFAGRDCGEQKVGEQLAPTHMLTPPFCCVFTRLSAQADQSGSSLCHHDQQLRVWEGFFPKIQPGEGVQASAHQQHLMVYPGFSSPKHTKLRTLHGYDDGAKFKVMMAN